MKTVLLALSAALLVIVLSQPAGAHHHPQPLPRPWTDRRPVVKTRWRGQYQLRPRYFWQSPSYLETAPVVFPGPAPLLPPLFAPAR